MNTNLFYILPLLILPCCDSSHAFVPCSSLSSLYKSFSFSRSLAFFLKHPSFSWVFSKTGAIPVYGASITKTLLCRDVLSLLFSSKTDLGKTHAPPFWIAKKESRRVRMLCLVTPKRSRNKSMSGLWWAGDFPGF